MAISIAVSFVPASMQSTKEASDSQLDAAANDLALLEASGMPVVWPRQRRRIQGKQAAAGRSNSGQRTETVTAPVGKVAVTTSSDSLPAGTGSTAAGQIEAERAQALQDLALLEASGMPVKWPR